MKKTLLIVSVLLGVMGLSLPARARQQDGSQVITQKITKTTTAAAANATVLYRGSPQFVPVAQTTISYAANSPQEVISIGDLFYLKTEGVWVVSANAQGPWTAPHFVPEVVSAIVCSQLHADPYDPYQLCTLPWGSGLTDAAWKAF